MLKNVIDISYRLSVYGTPNTGPGVVRYCVKYNLQGLWPDSIRGGTICPLWFEAQVNFVLLFIKLVQVVECEGLG